MAVATANRRSPRAHHRSSAASCLPEQLRLLQNESSLQPCSTAFTPKSPSCCAPRLNTLPQTLRTPSLLVTLLGCHPLHETQHQHTRSAGATASRLQPPLQRRPGSPHVPSIEDIPLARPYLKVPCVRRQHHAQRTGDVTSVQSLSVMFLRGVGAHLGLETENGQ